MTMVAKIKKDNAEKKKQPKGKSIHGITPFIRWVFVSLATILASLVIGIGSANGVFLESRERFSSTEDILNWIFTSMVAPYAVLYVMVFVASIYILSQSTMSYTWWVIKQSLSASLTYMVITLVIASMILGAAYAVSQPVETSINQTTDFAASQMWVVGNIAVAAVSWGAYKSAWKIYRVIGAQTMQQRYEADVAKMEVATSGRFWDKWVERPFRWFFGLDGGKPRGAMMFFVISIISTIITTSFVTVIDISLLMPIALLSVPASIVLLFAATAKHKDGRYNRKKPPVLNKVRDETTEDTYNPASKGHKVFVRS